MSRSGISTPTEMSPRRHSVDAGAISASTPSLLMRASPTLKPLPMKKPTDPELMPGIPKGLEKHLKPLGATSSSAAAAGSGAAAGQNGANAHQYGAKGAPVVAGRAESVGSHESGDSLNSVNNLAQSLPFFDRYIRKETGSSKFDELRQIRAKDQEHDAALRKFKVRFEALYFILENAISLSRYPFVVIAPDCTIMLVSPSIESLFGYHTSELVGHNVNIFMDPALAVRHDSIVQSYVDRVANDQLDNYISPVVNNTRPVTAVHRDGSPVSIEILVRCVLAHDAVEMGRSSARMASDGTKERAEALLFIAQLRDCRQEIALKNALFESMTLERVFPFPYLETDEHGIITKFNPAACKAFGYSSDRVVGKNVMVLMPKYIYSPSTGKKIAREQHDRLLANYVSKVKSVGFNNTNSTIVDQKTRHRAAKLNDSSPFSMDMETFPIEIEVKMVQGSNGAIKFQGFIRDVESLMNTDEAKNAIISSQSFPPPILQALKEGKQVNGPRDLSVIFCDIVGFTQYSTMLEDEKVLSLLGDIFGTMRDISRIVPSFNVIKTNYDEIMGVTGLDPRFVENNHADDAVRVAIEMIKAIHRYNADTSSQIAIRVGVDSGISMCGIIGSGGARQFDVIGNTAVRSSRAENTGKPNSVHITADTYARLSPDFVYRSMFVSNGKVKFKNMGDFETYIADNLETKLEGF